MCLKVTIGCMYGNPFYFILFFFLFFIRIPSYFVLFLFFLFCTLTYLVQLETKALVIKIVFNTNYSYRKLFIQIILVS